MKSIVIYFSQTGNTEKVARAIQAGITQATGQCDLQEIRDTNPLRLKDYDLIGLGAPVFGGCPKNVLQFVRRLRFVGGKHAFSFCTHGTMHGTFLPTLYPALADRGLSVIGSADWYGDCYLLHMPQPYPTAGHPDATDLEEAEAFGREMAVRSMRIRAGETDLIPAAPAPPDPPPPAPPGPSGDAPRVSLIQQAAQVRQGEVPLSELHIVHGQLPRVWDGPLCRSAHPGQALPRLRVLRPALPYGRPRHDSLSRSHGRHDGRLQAEDDRLFGRGRERRTFQAAHTAR